MDGGGKDQTKDLKEAFAMNKTKSSGAPPVKAAPSKGGVITKVVTTRILDSITANAGVMKKSEPLKKAGPSTVSTKSRPTTGKLDKSYTKGVPTKASSVYTK